METGEGYMCIYIIKYIHFLLAAGTLKRLKREACLGCSLRCSFSVSPLPFDLDNQGWEYSIGQPCL